MSCRYVGIAPIIIGCLTEKNLGKILPAFQLQFASHISFHIRTACNYNIMIILCMQF